MTFALAEWTAVDVEDDSPVPSPRAFHSMCRIKDFLFVYGGETGAYGPEAELLNDLWRFDMKRLRWNEVKHVSKSEGSVPPRISRHTCTFLPPDLLMVCGGFDGHVYTHEVHLYNLRTAKWMEYETSGDVPLGGLANHTATILPRGRILLAFTQAGSRNFEFAEVCLNHMAHIATFRHVVGIELQTALQQQKLKAETVKRFALALKKKKKKKKGEEEEEEEEESSSQVLEPRFSKFRPRLGHTTSCIKIKKDWNLLVVGGNVSAKNEVHNIVTGLGKWSAEFTVLMKLETQLVKFLDERRINSLGRQLQALDVFKAGCLPIETIVKLLGESMSLYVAVTEFTIFLRYYNIVMPLLALKKNNNDNLYLDENKEELEVNLHEFSVLLHKIIANKDVQNVLFSETKVARNTTLLSATMWTPSDWNAVCQWHFPKGRQYHSTTLISSAALPNQYLVTFGGAHYHGHRDLASGECLIYDIKGGGWFTIPVRRPVVRRFGHTACWWTDFPQCPKGGLLVFGGVGTSKIYSNSLQVLGAIKVHAEPARPDPEDGTMLFREDFIKKYGSTAEWKAQAPHLIAMREAAVAEEERKTKEAQELEARLRSAQVAEKERRARLQRLQAILTEQAMAQEKIEAMAVRVKSASRRNRFSLHQERRVAERMERKKRRRASSKGGSETKPLNVDNNDSGPPSDDNSTGSPIMAIFSKIGTLIRKETSKVAKNMRSVLAPEDNNEENKETSEVAKSMKSVLTPEGNNEESKETCEVAKSMKLVLASEDNNEENVAASKSDTETTSTDLDSSVSKKAQAQSQVPAIKLQSFQQGQIAQQQRFTAAVVIQALSRQKGVRRKLKVLRVAQKQAEAKAAAATMLQSQVRRNQASQAVQKHILRKKREDLHEETATTIQRLDHNNLDDVHHTNLDIGDDNDVTKMPTTNTTRTNALENLDRKIEETRKNPVEKLHSNCSEQITKTQDKHGSDTQSNMVTPNDSNNVVAHENQVVSECAKDKQSSSSIDAVSIASQTKPSISDTDSSLLPHCTRNSNIGKSKTNTILDHRLKVGQDDTQLSSEHSPDYKSINNSGATENELVLSQAATTGSERKKSEGAPQQSKVSNNENEVNWEEHVDDEGYTYFFNRKSGESQWERPLQTVLSRVYAMKAFGTTVNFTSTGATPPVSPRPDGTPRQDINSNTDENEEKDAWEEHIDEDGYMYYWNRKSGESQWEKPIRAIQSKIRALRVFQTT